MKRTTLAVLLFFALAAPLARPQPLPQPAEMPSPFDLARFAWWLPTCNICWNMTIPQAWDYWELIGEPN